MFKKFALALPATVLALSASMAFAVEPIPQVINIKATVPTSVFSVTPNTPGFGRDETMDWLASEKLSDITEVFNLKNTAADGAIHAFIDGDAKLYNGRDNIPLTVAIGGIELNDVSQEIVDKTASIPGVQRTMVIKASAPTATQSGNYTGSFAVVYEAVLKP